MPLTPGDAAALVVLLVGLVSLGNAGSWILAGPFIAGIAPALLLKGRFTHKLTLIQYVLLGAPFAALPGAVKTTVVLAWRARSRSNTRLSRITAAFFAANRTLGA